LQTRQFDTIGNNFPRQSRPAFPLKKQAGRQKAAGHINPSSTERAMTVTSLNSQTNSPLASPTTNASQSTSQSGSSSATSSSSSSASGGSSSSQPKTVVSEVSFTVDGTTTTTISYSDGTTETETSGGGNTAGSQKPQTYNAKGALQGGSDAGSAPGAGDAAGADNTASAGVEA
jgi:hypothetical protein